MFNAETALDRLKQGNEKYLKDKNNGEIYLLKRQDNF